MHRRRERRGRRRRLDWTEELRIWGAGGWEDEFIGVGFGLFFAIVKWKCIWVGSYYIPWEQLPGRSLNINRLSSREYHMHTYMQNRFRCG